MIDCQCDSRHHKIEKKKLKILHRRTIVIVYLLCSSICLLDFVWIIWQFPGQNLSLLRIIMHMGTRPTSRLWAPEREWTGGGQKKTKNAAEVQLFEFWTDIGKSFQISCWNCCVCVCVCVCVCTYLRLPLLLLMHAVVAIANELACDRSP